MKLIRSILLLLIMLTACSQDIPKAECKEGICIRIKFDGPVKALEPARYVISVRTEKDIQNLPVNFQVDPGTITIAGIEKIPESARLVYQDKSSLGWQINTKGGEEYFLSGFVILSHPAVSYGVFNYSIATSFSQPDFGSVTASTHVYLDSEGNPVDENKARSVLQTGFPAPSSRPDLTIVPETPMPAAAWPTEAPLLPMTPTAAAYLAPNNPGSILPVYPYP